MADKRQLLFITGNNNKLREAKEILHGFDVKSKKIELPELQEVNEQFIVEEKIRQALKVIDQEVFVEDTSLCLDSLNGLPGPLIKWFIDKIGSRGVADMISSFDDKTAYAKCYIGYGIPATEDVDEKIMIFEGSVKGRIVEPADGSGFGFDYIFVPDGYDQTFSQMGPEEKNKISHRRLALEKFREYLVKKH
ncbi:MAG: RdgB/HAM1 family non-canonical purine NTP pyrophosphatase [Candidatus Woesearchaeota archaeon]